MTLISPFEEERFRRATAPEEDPSPLPRTMLVFAHPDDETVALGARLGRFGSAHFVHVTDGAPRSEYDSSRYGFPSWREYRDARAKELARLFESAGIAEVSRECLGIPDQQASHTLAALTRRLSRLLEEHRPEVVFTHPYEGGHPDHDACAFAAHHAVTMLEPSRTVPLLIECAFYNTGQPERGPGYFLPLLQPVLEAEYTLAAEERRRKQARFDCFTTQAETLRAFPLDAERFRVAPEYDFEQPPHPGPVLYDRYPWGMTSTRFRELSGQAAASLREESMRR